MEGQGQRGDGAEFGETRRFRSRSSRRRQERRSRRRVGEIEKEHRELLAQVEDITRELGKLHEQWEDPNPELACRAAQLTEEIEERIIVFIRRWECFPECEAVPAAMSAALDGSIRVLAEQDRHFPSQFPSLTWLNQVVVPLLSLARIYIEPSENNREICRMCSCKFRTGEVARKLLCGHRYHHRCILEREQSCPLCRVIPIRISGDHVADKNSNTSACSICTVDFELAEVAGQLHCGHIYHRYCIWTWLRLRSTCPICRRKFQ